MVKQQIRIGETGLSLEDFRKALSGPCEVSLAQRAQASIEASHQAVARLLRGPEPIYGVNTGFGKLAKSRIAASDLGKLQVNLVRSHAAGTGEPLDPATVRLSMTLKLASLAQGYSGIAPATAQLLARE